MLKPLPFATQTFRKIVEDGLLIKIVDWKQETIDALPK